MLIELYSNVFINKSYSHVYVDHKHLNYYLDHNGYIVRKNFEIEDFYIQDKGTINLDWFNQYEDNHIYSYFRIKNYHNQDWYFFIEKTELKNDVLIIYYSLDKFHTYIPYAKLNFTSLLTSCSATEFLGVNGTVEYDVDYYHLPFEYESNKPFIIKNGVNFNERKIYNSFSLIVKIQYYSSGISGTQSYRNQFFQKVGLIETDSNGNSTWKNSFTMKEIVTLISQFQIRSQYESGTLWVIGDNGLRKSVANYYISIEHFYVIPTEYAPSSLFKNETDFDSLLNHYYGFSVNISMGELLLYDVKDYSATLTTIRTDTLENNFKNVSIGTFTNRIVLNNNGHNRIIEYKCLVTNLDFRYYLVVDGTYYEITKDFELYVPFATLEGTNALINRVRVTMDLINSGLSVVSSIASLGTNASIGNLSLTGETTTTTNEKRRYGKQRALQYNAEGEIKRLSSPSITSIKSTSSTRQTGVSYEEMINSTTKTLSSVAKLTESSLQSYAPPTSYDIENSSIVNIIYGICVFEIDTPVNENVVYNMTGNLGYAMNYFCGEWVLFHQARAHPVSIAYKFENADVYGRFNNEIASLIQDVLEDGCIVHWEPKGSV